MPRPKKKSSVASLISPVVIIPRVLTIPDAARYLSATLWFTEQLLRDGEVRSFIQGKSRVVDRLELDKYVDRRNTEKSERLIQRLENLKAA
jgi:excisionase family DNA binding protein